MKSLFFLSFFMLMVFSIFFFFYLCLMFLNLNSSIFVQWDFFLSNFKISFPMFFDWMSCLFMSLVLMISSSIMFYSFFYMESELPKDRFFFLMFFFILSMIFLIISPNFLCMLLGWDGLGLVSYGLVIFYQNFKSFSAGMITALTNRIGDVFILGSIFLCSNMGSWNYMNFLKLNKEFFLIIFFVLAAMTKSAQIPFSAWLPAAMAAPTPVSSLVHSSTLVTAGIYILIRFNFLIESKTFTNFLVMISMLTMIMSGISGCFEYDLKKIIALSTLSQLGLMMGTVSMGMNNLAFFHLVTHACFKALLFMCSGIFIHMYFDNQDIRYFGLMNKNFSFILCLFNCANLSLCGFPFLSGFFSKDLILEMVMMKEMNFIIFFLFKFGTFLTVFYSFRLKYFLTLKFYFPQKLSMNMKFLLIQKSLFLLFIFSILLGFFKSKFIFLPQNFIILPFKLKVFIIKLCILSFFKALIFKNSLNYLNLKKLFVLFMWNMWFMYFLKTDFLKFLFLDFGSKVNKISLGWVEILYGNKFNKNMSFFSFFLNKISLMFFFLSFSLGFFFMSFLYFMLI
uniref:NADH-ubiquinone oxidoreductase chain 5 n=1 Tax=Dendrothrips minowai TaxID=1030662 RepID=A0A343WRP0_9NEOP|nr:NADH dehydrogenase subunit 5 [Dendrothrips minowai]AWD37109.1 NADH dehydrogenase subunit 5 [Dendrothrips minowai]